MTPIREDTLESMARPPLAGKPDAPFGSRVARGALPRRLACGALIGAALILTVVVRTTSWDVVFTRNGTRFLIDGDPWYHVLRARQLALEGRVEWRDPALNYPYGAEVPWPPLFDLLLAGSARASTLGPLDAARVDAASAWVPVIISVAITIAGAAIAGELLGAWGAAAAALLLALSAPLVGVGMLGRPDQHILEALLFAGMTHALLRSVSVPKRGAAFPWAPAGALAALLALAFWTWLGSALSLVACGAVAAALHVAGPSDAGARRGAHAIAAASSGAAVLLAITVSLFGPPRALGTMSLGGMSAFQVLLCAATSAATWALVAAGRRGDRSGPVRRLGEVAIAGLMCVGLVLAASPTARDAAMRGLAAVGRGNPWYDSIQEYRHVLSTGFHPLARELRMIVVAYGLSPVLAVLGALELRRRWRAGEGRASVLVLGTLAALFLALAAYMWRFWYYAALPLALLDALALAAVWRWLARAPLWARAGGVAAALAAAVAPTVPALASEVPVPLDPDELSAVLAPARDAPEPDAGAVLAAWALGHHVRALSGRPVVASPFGTEGGSGAMEDTAQFFLSADDAAVEELLRRRHVRWVLLGAPESSVRDAALFLGRDSPLALRLDPERHAEVPDARSEYERLVAARLFYLAGGASRVAPALGGFRLVSESVQRRGGPPHFRLFEAVAGARARVSGAMPGALVTVHTRLRTPGWATDWTAAVRATGAGEASFRLPYATGRTGEVMAMEYQVRDGTRSAWLSVSEQQVEDASLVEVRLGDH